MDRANGLEHNDNPRVFRAAIPAGSAHHHHAPAVTGLLFRWLCTGPSADVLRLLPRPLPVAEP
jgi:hypothetical protein